MTLADVAMLGVAVLGGAAALLVVTARNVVHAALYLVVALLAVAATLRAGEEKTINLDGVWVPTSVTVDGKMTDKEKLKDIKLTIKGNSYTVHAGDKEVNKGTFTVDASKKPATIDLVAVSPDGEKVTLEGIVKLEKDTMTVCAATPGRDRPTEFTSKEGSRQQLAVYERQKK